MTFRFEEHINSVFQKHSSAGEASMMINLEKFLSPRALETLSGAGLHKVAAALEKVANHRDVGDEMNLAAVVTTLGQKAFIKRAEQRQIVNGILAYRELIKES